MAGRKKRWPGFNLIVVGGLTLLAFALRVYHLGGPSLWYDELLQLDLAQGPFSQIWPQLERHAAMPLDYYLLHGWLKLGRQETWVRFPALFFGTLTIPLTYVLAAHLFSRSIGYLAAVLFTSASFAIHYSQEARPYALLLFLVLLGYWGLWQVYQTDKHGYWGWVVIGLVGATLTHYFALFILFPMGLFVVWQQLLHLKQKRHWQHTAYFGLCLLLILLVLILVGRFWRLYSVGVGFAGIIDRPEALTLPAPEKPNQGTGPSLEPAFFIESLLAPLGTTHRSILLLYNLFFFSGCLFLVLPRQKNGNAILLLLAWLFIPILLIYLFLLQRGTFFAARYILYTLPAYLILVAYGLDRLAIFLSQVIRQQSNQTKIFYGGLLILALGSLISAEVRELMVYYSAESREDWRAVGQLLRQNASPGDAVIAVNAEPAINWYYSPASRPFGTFNRNERLVQALREAPRRWFVLSSYSFKRDQSLRDWLKQHDAVILAIDRRVVVYFHEEGLSHQEMLACVQTFSLPQKALTYATLADQFKVNGDLETSRIFYQKAIQLAKTDAQKASFRARLTALIVP